MTAQTFSDHVAHVQPDAYAVCFSLCTQVLATKEIRVEKVLLVFLAEPDSLVPHLNYHVGGPCVTVEFYVVTDLNSAFLGREVNSVSEKINEDLLNSHPVSLDGEFLSIFGALDYYFNFPLSRIFVHDLACLLDQAAYMHIFFVQLERVVLKTVFVEQKSRLRQKQISGAQDKSYVLHLHWKGSQLSVLR